MVNASMRWETSAVNSTDGHENASGRASTIQSFARVIEVLRAFGPASPRMSVVEVARATQLSRATARRLLVTLEELGYVRSEDRVYSLTPKILDLGFRQLSTMTMTDAVTPQLEALGAELGESTSAAILDGTDIVYIARVPSRRIVSLGIDVGTRLPAFATAMGRVLLSDLSDDDLDDRLARSDVRQITPRTLTDGAQLRAAIRRTQQRGWAMVNQEALEAGLCSIAAPIYRSGRIVAAINVSTAVRDGDAAEALTAFRDPLLTTAASLSEALEYLPS